MAAASAASAATRDGGAIHVCLQVPRGTWDLGPLVEAIERHHPDWEIGAVWCGDPHRRPRAHERAPWIDRSLPEPTGAGWGCLLVGLPERCHDWARTSVSVARLLDEGAAGVVVLRVGSVAVLGDLGALVADDGVALAPRTRAEPPVDGLAPGPADLAALGNCSSVVASFGPSSARTARTLASVLVAVSDLARPDDDLVGHALLEAQRSSNGRTVPAGTVEVLGWSDHGSVVDTAVDRASDTASPCLIDLDALDRDEPWHVSFAGRPTRLRLSADRARATLVELARPQVDGTPRPITLPGGIEIDAPIRALVGDALAAWRRGEGTLPPEPFGRTQSSFLRWLETPSPVWGADIGRYWRVLREQRADLQAAFPRSDSTDMAAFAGWAARSWRVERRSVLVRPRAGAGRSPVASMGLNAGGINVVGYLGYDSSLGDVARRIVSCLEAAHVPVTAIDHHRTGSPRTTVPPTTSTSAHHRTNLIVVNADQFHFFVADHGDALLRGRRNIAYWFWELEHVPAAMREAIAHVDEIWAGTRFVADAFAAITDTPVRCVPVPVPEPRPSGATRTDLGMPEGRFTFLVTFDHFSVAERKNPWGAVEAFRRAFPHPDPAGPVLVVKTVNGDRRWVQHERLLLATADRPDIVVVDAHLDRADQMAVIARADCLVSLHRSEGLGLHCAEAMWLGKPVVATRYSGNLDFMSDDDSILIDAAMVPVSHGEGVYPPEARWADPDLDQAAAALRRLATEPGLVERIGRAARSRMQAQAGLAATGRAIAREAALPPYVPGPSHVVAAHRPPQLEGSPR